MTGTTIRPLVAALALRDALQRAGVPFVHWKSNDHLAEALAGKTDIDLYVDPAHRQQFEEVMIRFGALRFDGENLQLEKNIASFVEIYGRRIPLEQIPKLIVTFDNLRVNGRPPKQLHATATYAPRVPKYAEATAVERAVVIRVGEPVERNYRSKRLF